jgi:hypothetical protein
MIVSSSVGLLTKKFDNQNLNNLMLRTDGFKNVFRGLTYKHSMPKSSQGGHAGTYTSIGKRTPAKEYHFTKDAESKLECEEEKSKQFRRTQTAEIASRAKGDCREKDFSRAEKEESECFSKLL